MAESQTDVDATCERAMTAAFEKGMEWCGSQDGRIQALSRVVGVDADEVDTDAALDAGPSEPEDRHWVLARAEELVAEDGTSPLDATDRAWREHDEKIADADEPDADEDESESGEDDDEEPEVADEEDGGGDDPLEEVADSDVIEGPDEDEK